MKRHGFEGAFPFELQYVLQLNPRHGLENVQNNLFGRQAARDLIFAMVAGLKRQVIRPDLFPESFQGHYWLEQSLDIVTRFEHEYSVSHRGVSKQIWPQRVPA